MEWLSLLPVAVVLYLLWRLGGHRLRQRRRRFIDDYLFHEAVDNKLRVARPTLKENERELVISALRDYFHCCNRAGRRMVAMPSQVVDDAWHAFILYTRAYECFCSKAFGRFLHHTPAEAMTGPTVAQDGIKRAWRLACAEEGIDPKKPSRLPLLFAIDQQLGIEGGFYYDLHCTPSKPNNYCASHIGCGGGCAGGSGCGGDSGGWFDGDGAGCGGGCGGD